MPDIVVPTNRVFTGDGNRDSWYAHRFYYANVVNSSGSVGVAAVLTGNIILPPYTLLLGVVVTSAALWNQGTSALMDVGDADDPDGLLTQIDCKATDLLQYESAGNEAGTALAGGKIGAYIANSQWGKGSGTYGQLSPLARTLTAKLTTVGTAATTGDIYVYWHVLPPFNGGTAIQAATVTI